MSRKLMPHPVDIHGFFLSQILRCPILFLRDFIHYFRKKVVLCYKKMEFICGIGL